MPGAPTATVLTVTTAPLPAAVAPAGAARARAAQIVAIAENVILRRELIAASIRRKGPYASIDRGRVAFTVILGRIARGTALALATLGAIAALCAAGAAAEAVPWGYSCIPASTEAPRTSETCGATLLDGKAIPPPNAPPQVKAVIAAANRIVHRPYVWGGGHLSWWTHGYDCSGAVSFALHGGGLLDDDDGLRPARLLGRAAGPGAGSPSTPTTSTSTWWSPGCASTPATTRPA